MFSTAPTWDGHTGQLPAVLDRVRTFIGRVQADIAQRPKAQVPSCAIKTGGPGKVLLLPGLMGSHLSVITNGQPDLIWPNPARIATGGIDHLKWPKPIRASGALAVSYKQMLVRLRLAGFDADFLPYDWRQAPDITGRTLMAQLIAKGQRDVTLVCHSLGGLVARQMAAMDPQARIIRKIITIGTPNHGSYAAVQMFDLSHPTIDMFAHVDIHHDARTLVRRYLRDFPGLVSLLPTPAMRPNEGYFDPANWPAGTIAPRAALLRRAGAAVAALPAPDSRFHQIIGIGRSTIDAARATGDGFAFNRSLSGDGVVARDLAEMGDVPRYYARTAHGRLCNNEGVIKATLGLIEEARTSALPAMA